MSRMVLSVMLDLHFLFACLELSERGSEEAIGVDKYVNRQS